MIRTNSLPFLSLSQLGMEVATRIGSFARAVANRIAVRELAHYDERMLKDIGLTRSDIVSALDSGLAQDPSVRLRKLAAGRGRV